MGRLEKIIQNKKIIYPLFFIFIICFVIALSPMAMQNDVFWSIKVGEKLVNEGIWEIDDFSQHEGLKYIAHHFLTDVVIYIVHLIGRIWITICARNIVGYSNGYFVICIKQRNL